MGMYGSEGYIGGRFHIEMPWGGVAAVAAGIIPGMGLGCFGWVRQ